MPATQAQQHTELEVALLLLQVAAAAAGAAVVEGGTATHDNVAGVDAAPATAAAVVVVVVVESSDAEVYVSAGWGGCSSGRQCTGTLSSRKGSEGKLSATDNTKQLSYVDMRFSCRVVHWMLALSYIVANLLKIAAGLAIKVAIACVATTLTAATATASINFDLHMLIAPAEKGRNS